jgi:uncharacterized protein YjeT (DUF2065 family)
MAAPVCIFTRSAPRHSRRASFYKTVMSYIDVLIPGVIGVLLVASPRLFTKAQGESFESARKKLRTIGFVLIGVAVLYLFIKLAHGS